MISIPIHSITSLITNSSTTIYTYSENSEQCVKELIEEILKTFNIKETCDEMFSFVVLADSDVYEDYIEGNDEEEIEAAKVKGIDKNTDLDQLFNDVKNGKLDKPSWYKDAEDREGYDGYPPETTLYIIAKKPEYEKIAKLIHDVVYSTSHEGCYN